MAYTISSFITTFTEHILDLDKRVLIAMNKNNKRLISYKILIIVVIVAFLLPSLINPVIVKFEKFPGSKMMDYEYTTALWLRYHTRETDLIISDYWTMMLLNPISNHIWITDKKMFASDLDPEYIPILNRLRNEVFKASSSREAYEALLNLSKIIIAEIDWVEQYYINCMNISIDRLGFLIVITPRTVTWIEYNISDVITPSFSYVNQKYLLIFNDTNYFDLVFFIPQKVYVFKLLNSSKSALTYL